MSPTALKIFVTAVAVVAAISGLLFATLREDTQFYKHVDEVMTDPSAWHGRRLQLHGYVAAIERQPDLGSDVYQKLGNIALRRRHPDDAMSHWRRALQLDPANQIVRMNLDTLMRSEARMDRAS